MLCSRNNGNIEFWFYSADYPSLKATIVVPLSTSIPSVSMVKILMYVVFLKIWAPSVVFKKMMRKRRIWNMFEVRFGKTLLFGKITNEN